MTEVQNQTISGSGRRDTLSGNGGDDTIKGRNGADDLDGGAGNDTLDGGNGRDTLFGGEGDDTLFGGNGNDRFVIDGDLAGQSFDTIMDFDVGRELRSMTFNDTLELRNVAGQDVRFVQNGEDVDLFIGGNLMAVFKGSQGLLNAADLLAATTVIGDAPASLAVDTPPQPESLFDGILINGIDAGDFSGFSVSSAGDVDGDGKDDVIIGAQQADPDGASAAGESYLVFGSALAAAAGTGGTGEIDLATLAPSEGILIKGIDVTDFSGRSVSSAGDVDGDGLDDVIIGADGGDPDGASAAGESYLVFGSALAAAAGVGGSGEIDLATLTPSQGILIKGIDGRDRSGISVSGAGDVDGDGLDDVIIGADRADPDGASSAGESYVISGALLLEESTTGDGVIDLADLFVV